MAIALDVLGFAILSGLVFVWIAFLYFTYHRLRRKGYQPPGASLALLVVCAVAIVLTVLGFPASTDALTGYRFLAYAFYLPIGLSMALMMVVALTLPGRRARRFGRRTSRFPFRLFGGAIVSLGVFVAVYAVAAFFFVPDWKADGAGEAVAFLITVGLYVIWFGRRSQHQLSADQAAADKRAAVLYLRPFRQESQFFVIGPKAKYGMYTSSLHARLAKSYQNIGITLEDYLDEAIRRSIGPFVALGSPEDYLPPDGAARTYAADNDWQGQFTKLADKASAILVEAGASGHLNWEFGELRRRELQQKLFLLWPPKRAKKTGLSWAFYRLLWWLKGIRRVPWDLFSAQLKRMGYRLGGNPPPAGSVIGFDADGTSVLITAEAEAPTEFIEPIHAWAQGPSRMGHVVPVVCSTCLRTYYIALSATVGVPALCPECQPAADQE